MKGNRLSILFSVAICVFMFCFVSLSFAAPAPKATGSVGFVNEDIPAMVYFNAHAAYSNPAGKARPAKGFLYYGEVTDAAQFYILDVQCVFIDGNQATFGGEIVETNVAGWEEQLVQIWVLDGGTPGSNGDMIFGEFLAEGTDPNCTSDALLDAADTLWIPVKTGNLVVHKTPKGQPNKPAPRK